MEGTRFRLFLGVDVSRSGFQVAFFPSSEDALPISWKNLDSEFFAPCKEDFSRLAHSITQWAAPNQTCVAVDHTGGYYVAPLVRFLTTLGCSVVYIPGNLAKDVRKKLFLSEAKTDHIDAKTLAYAVYLHHVLGMRLSLIKADLKVDSQALTLLQLSRLRQRLVFERVQVTNRLRQLLAAAFPEAVTRHGTTLLKLAAKYPVPEDILAHPTLPGIRLNSRTRTKFLKLAQTTVGVSTPALRESIQVWAQFYTMLGSHIDEIEARIAAALARHPYGQILLSFPNVGTIRAAMLIGLIDNIDRWQNSGKLKKTLGIYGVTEQSGSTTRVVRGTSGSRVGKSLVMQTIASAIRNSKKPNDFNDCYQRHRKRGAPPIKAMYKAASKLIEILYYCLRTGQMYEYQGSRQPQSGGTP